MRKFLTNICMCICKLFKNKSADVPHANTHLLMSTSVSIEMGRYRFEPFPQQFGNTCNTYGPTAPSRRIDSAYGRCSLRFRH